MTKKYFESWKQKASQTKAIYYKDFGYIDFSEVCWNCPGNPKVRELKDIRFNEYGVTLSFIFTYYNLEEYVSENVEMFLKRTDIDRIEFLKS